MKKMLDAAANNSSKTMVNSLLLLLLAGQGLFFSACQKNDVTLPKYENIVEGQRAVAPVSLVYNYEGLSFQTRWELQQARAATAKYQNVENAIADNYEDIKVDMEHMGHHYMKKSLVNDGQFEITKPEILVYNKDENGKLQLVAVEYAVPLQYPRPEGFTGSDDEWDENTGFGLWLLHAWVWYPNPQGVFKPLNPLIHLH